MFKSMFKSLNLGKLFGVDIAIHWSVLILLLFYYHISELDGVVMNLLLFVMILFFIFIHVYSRTLLGRIYDIMDNKVIINGLGVMTSSNKKIELLEPKKRILVSSIGPLITLTVFLLLFAFFNMVVPTGTHSMDEFSNFEVFYIIATVVNFIIFILSILPFYTFDGSRIISGVLELFGMKRFKLVLIGLNFLFSGFIVMVGIMVPSILLIIAGVVFLLIVVFELMDYRTNIRAIKQATKFTDSVRVLWRKLTDENKVVFISELREKMKEIDNEKISYFVNEVIKELNDTINVDEIENGK